MNRLYNYTRHFLFFGLLLIPIIGKSQCYTSFTTYNYFCDLDSLILEAVPDGTAPYTFIWETGETTQQIIIPLALGDYMLTVTDATGCVAVINCHVKPYPDVLYYPFNQNACEGAIVTLYLEWFRDSIPGATYEWSTGATTSWIQVTEDITWSATVTDPSNGCEYIVPPNFFDFHDIPDPEIVGPTEICDGQTITLSVNGAAAGFITWYPDYSYEETLEVTEPGQYWVQVSNEEAYWCFAYDTIVITEGEIPEPLLSGPPDLCNNQTGIVQVTNNLLFEEFIWSNGETEYSFEAQSPGTYTVTVTEQSGCTATASIVVEDALENGLFADITAATCGESNGSIIISYTISGSYEFEWSNGETTQNLEDVPSGTYTVTVTNEEGCSSTIVSEIPEEEIDIVINEIISPNTSCTEFNGAIDIVISPSGDFDYLWSTGAVTEDVEGLFPGSYSVTVSEGLTCSSSADFIIEDLSAAPDVQSIVQSATCGETNGSIELQLTGGTDPFSFAWSNGQITQNIVDVAAGTYTVTVTASDGCITTSSVTVPNNNPPITLNGVVTPNTLCNSSNGGIDLSPSPSASFNFIWSTGASTEDLTGLGSGNYIVTVTLGAACSTVETFTITSESLPFEVTGATTQNTSCNAPNGSIDLSINPSGSYSFAWSSGESGEDLNNLAGGNYIVTVTSTDGCSISSAFNIDNTASSFSVSGISIANTSCTVPNGMIDITVTPPGTFTFLWSNGQTTEDLQNATPGAYTVTITNIDACTQTSSFTVDNQSAGFTLSGVPTDNSSCAAPNGSLDLSVTPAGTYAFNWSNGNTSEDLAPISGGSYSVTVTDNNSCSASQVFSVQSTTSDPVVTGVTTNEVCGASNGGIDLSATPAGNIFIWSNGAPTEDISSLAAGTYYVTVTGANGCATLDTFTVSSMSNNFAISATPVDNTSCINPNGSINLSVTPSGTYTFVWSNGATTQQLQNLDAGTFTVTVTDNLNCSSVQSFVIGASVSDPVISESISPSSCGNATGAININVTPSAGNTFEWSNGATTKDLQNLAGGNYSITVTGANGCSATASFIVPDQNSNFTPTGVAVINTSCSTPNGSIDLTITPAGTYTFNWSNGAVTSDLQNLAGGNYQVTITDQFNCSSTLSFTVNDNSAQPVLSYTTTPATCGQLNGAVDITVSVTTTNTFSWSNGSTTEDLVNVHPGTYQVTVSDAGGCSAELSVVIPNQNSNFDVSSIQSDDQSCITPTGFIDLTVTPSGSYTFVWSNGAATEDLNGLVSGLYEVTVTDNFNCSTSEVFTIENISTPPLVSDIISHASCGESQGRIDLTVTPSSGNMFEWSTGVTTEDLHDIAPGTYSVTVTDANGCTIKGVYDVDGSTPLVLSLDADLTGVAQNGGVMCSLQLNVPLSAIDSIVWLPANLLSCHEPLCMQQLFNVIEQTQVMVMVMDTHGCMATVNLLLDIDPEFQVYIPNVFTPNNDGPNDMFTVYANEEVEEVVVLEIFDRWGNCVFINELFPPNEPNYGWDGVYSNKPMNPDVFAYRAVVRYSNGEQHAFKGDVTLVR